MNNGNSPLEMLAAFAIVFFAGVASAASLAAYKKHLQKATPVANRPATRD